MRTLADARFDIYDSISADKYEAAVNSLLTTMWEDSSIEVNENYKNRLSIRHKAQSK